MWLALSANMQTNELSQFRKLVEANYPTLFRFASRLCGSPTEAMALTQRTFREAFETSRDLPIPANIRSWLFAILFHRFLEARPRILVA
jgi:DNA-directed RNA polymerase specialized sigma24 family protein